MRLAQALDMLGLASLPVSEVEVKRAWRAAAFLHHPDKGGSQAAFTRLRDAMDVIVECMANPSSGYDAPRHGATYRDALALPGPVSHVYVPPPAVDLRRWWREQAMLELLHEGIGHWTREGVMRDGTSPIRRKVRR